MPHIVFTRRPDNLKRHAGQISFPGGGEETTDPNPQATALRELEEELGVSRTSVRVLGTLDELPTVTDFLVRPFVGALPKGTTFHPSVAEVAEVIEVPVTHLLRPDILRIEQRMWRGVLHDVHAFDYQQHTIWGATGRILFNFIDVARDLPAFQELSRT